MSITKIRICDAAATPSSADTILLSITDAEKSNCRITPMIDGLAARIDLEITRADDVSSVIGDLLSSFDFDSTEYVLLLKSRSAHIRSSDVAFLLSALFPGTPMESDGHDGQCEIAGFILNIRPIYKDAAHVSV